MIDMKREKSISVIVPVYNVEAYLKRCLDSLILQSFSDFEILLVDDGSTDRSPEICDEYAEADKRVKVFHTSNAGVAAARNLGLAYASGQYIMFVDSDDYVDSDFFKIMYDWIEHEHCDIVQCDFAVTSDSKCEFEKSGESYECETGRQAFVRFFDGRYVGMYELWNKIYRKNLWCNLEIPQLSIGEDDAVLNEVYFRAKKIVFIHQKLYAYFQSEQSAMRGSYSLKQLDAITSHEIKRRFFYDNHLEEYYLSNDTLFLARLLRHYYLLNYNLPDEKDKINELKDKIRKVGVDLIKSNTASIKYKVYVILSMVFPKLMSLKYRGEWRGH